MLEVLSVLAVVSILAGIALPAYEEHQTRVSIADVQKDFGLIEMRIERYYFSFNKYPASLADIELDDEKDPWGNVYRYYNHATGEGNAVPKLGGDLLAVNSDFDLYSMGPDGATNRRLSLSEDDIIRAMDGDFLGGAYVYCDEYDDGC